MGQSEPKRVGSSIRYSPDYWPRYFLRFFISLSSLYGVSAIVPRAAFNGGDFSVGNQV